MCAVMVNLKTYRNDFTAEKGQNRSISPKLVVTWLDALGCGGAIITISTPALSAASNSFGIVLPPSN